MFSYVVRCSLTDAETANAWLHWLEDEHVEDVLAAGAVAAEIVKQDDELHFEIRYRFASRLEFESYQMNHAPRLRDEGLKRFPLSMGLTYSRVTGEVIATFSR